MVMLLLTLAVLIWARQTHKPWSELGLARPRSWITTILVGILVGVAFKFCMKAVVMPLLGAPPVNQAFRNLTGNTAALPEMILTILISAAFGEEVVFRGFLFDRFRRLFGTRTWATVLTVVLSAALFGAAHWSGQGLPGVQQAVIVGLVFGAVYARTRNLWGLMVVHAAFDLTAVWMIYYGLEERFSRFIFK